MKFVLFIVILTLRIFYTSKFQTCLKIGNYIIPIPHVLESIWIPIGCVYLSTLAKFPLQNARSPSEAMVLLVQSRTPLYLLSRTPCLIISSWFCTISLTLSMGAAAVFDTPAATPESMKFSKKLNFFPPSFLAMMKTEKKKINGNFFLKKLMTFT